MYRLDINTEEGEEGIRGLVHDFLVSQPPGDTPVKSFIRLVYYLSESDDFTRGQIAFVATRYAFRYASGAEERIREFAGVDDEQGEGNGQVH
jgi:hypothetical protein